MNNLNPFMRLVMWVLTCWRGVMDVSVMTGASLWEAGIVALIEPAINGVWFYILHSLWRKLQ